jgi:hypothetical protein
VRTARVDGYYAVTPMLPELRSRSRVPGNAITKEVSSLDGVLSLDEVRSLLDRNELLGGDPGDPHSPAALER